MTQLLPQKDTFALSQAVTYLNCAYMSPTLKASEAAAIQAVKDSANPFLYSADSFFEPVNALKASFAKLIGSDDPERIAIIPSASYGIGNVTNNIHLRLGDNVIVAGEQFPSNVYPWMELTKTADAQLITISAPDQKEGRGKRWNKAILEAINERTRAVALGHVHWADGTLFDLKSIRQRTREVGALLIIDGTQSVGALPFDIKEYEPDALICAGYKWLLGPYGLGLAYYGPYFDGGKPIENNWIGRKDSHLFQYLVNYQDEYRPKAARFSVGENSNFILNPILKTGIDQVLEWGPERIQAYCASLLAPFIERFKQLGCFIEEEDARSAHLFGIGLPRGMDEAVLKRVFSEEKVLVSFRGPAVRVSPHLYNDASDMEHLLACFEKAMVGEMLSR